MAVTLGLWLRRGRGRRVRRSIGVITVTIIILIITTIIIIILVIIGVITIIVIVITCVNFMLAQPLRRLSEASEEKLKAC